MTRSELIEHICRTQTHLSYRLLDDAIKHVFEQMIRALSDKDRIEIRGFGSFEVRCVPPRVARNPKTGEIVNATARLKPHFKPGKELRQRVATSAQKGVKLIQE